MLQQTPTRRTLPGLRSLPQFRNDLASNLSLKRDLSLFWLSIISKRLHSTSVPFLGCSTSLARKIQNRRRPLPSTSPAESILALFAGPDRAAAILGDLTEMAATRGRAWFLTAYARTLVSFTWRIVLALVVATIGRQLIENLFHIYIWHTFAAWRTTNGSF